MSAKSTVVVVDDDPEMRSSLARLVRSAGLDAKAFASGGELLADQQGLGCGCLLLDMQMPGLSGLELQTELETRGIRIPIIFLTGHGDVSASVRAMKHGAADFLTKPVSDTVLLAAIRDALAQAQQSQAATAAEQQIRARFQTLTARERQVFALVTKGCLNKQVAGELGISLKTVKVHRARVMQKMGVVSVAHLVQAAVKLGMDQPKLPDPDPRPTAEPDQPPGPRL